MYGTDFFQNGVGAGLRGRLRLQSMQKYLAVAPKAMGQKLLGNCCRLRALALMIRFNSNPSIRGVM